MASPETVPRDLDETTVTIIQDTPERRLAVLGEIDEAYGRDVRAGARRHGRRLRGGVKRAVAPFARALGARHPRRAAASGGKSLSSPSSLPPMLTSKLTSHHDHTARACTKRGKYNPPPGPTPGAYLAGRHTLNCRYLWRPEGRIASGRKTLARHFSPVRAGLQKYRNPPLRLVHRTTTGGSHAPGQPISAPGASHHNQGQHTIYRWPSTASARLC